MYKKVLLTLMLIFPCFAQAMQCDPDEGLEMRFKEADSVLLIYIVSTRLKTTSLYGDEIKYSEAIYELVESFKGLTAKNGKVIELLGYGTGMVGLIPGIYYVVFIQNDSSELEHPWVNVCNTLYSSLNLKGLEFIKQLGEIRSLK